MKIQEFSLILNREPDESESDQIAGLVEDATIVTVAGIPQMWFHREAPTLDEAIHSAIADLKGSGFDVERVVIESDVLKSA